MVKSFTNTDSTADLERNVPITPATVFDIGPIVKQFTAMSIALLATQGKLSLDEKELTFKPGDQAHV
jgi:CubicO group peptidase (beta-lactamase class C family)